MSQRGTEVISTKKARILFSIKVGHEFFILRNFLALDAIYEYVQSCRWCRFDNMSVLYVAAEGFASRCNTVQ